MKNLKDPRHIRRIEVVKSLFAWDYDHKQKTTLPLTLAVIKKVKKIDDIISQSAPEWPVKQINRIDLAILRLAVYEINFLKTDPQKVIIDEAVEIAKAFGSENSPKFINGVLGNIINDHK